MRLRDSGLNNSETAKLLGVSEASVRRGLAGYQPEERSKVRQLLNELADVLEQR